MYEPDFERDPERLYAGDLRAAGVDIPETIPDCASVARSSVRLGEPEIGGDPDQGLITGTIPIIWTEPFEWYSFNLVFPDKCGDSDGKG